MEIFPNYTKYAWLRRGKRRQSALRLLYNSPEPLTATDIKKALKVDITQASFTLIELTKQGLIECLNPKDHHGKIYAITKEGKSIVKRFFR